MDSLRGVAVRRVSYFSLFRASNVVSANWNSFEWPSSTCKTNLYSLTLTSLRSRSLRCLYCSCNKTGIYFPAVVISSDNWNMSVNKLCLLRGSACNTVLRKSKHGDSLAD